MCCIRGWQCSAQERRAWHVPPGRCGAGHSLWSPCDELWRGRCGSALTCGSGHDASSVWRLNVRHQSSAVDVRLGQSQGGWYFQGLGLQHKQATSKKSSNLEAAVNVRVLRWKWSITQRAVAAKLQNGRRSCAGVHVKMLREHEAG